MNIAMINTADLRGGAARAVYRLHNGIRSLGINSRMFVQEKISDENSIIGPRGKVARGINSVRPTIDMLPLYLGTNSNSAFSLAWFPSLIHERLADFEIDLVHLHWINKGFLPIRSIKKLPNPLVWTLHDMWAFTGGCHYDLGCDRFTEQCGACPQIGGRRNHDLSRWTWTRKFRSWRDLDCTIVCPSKWLADMAKRSSLFGKRRIEVIANGIDLERFRPIDREIARKWIGLPQSKILLMFNAYHGTRNTIKGFQFLFEIFSNLYKLGWKDQIEIIVVGSSRPTNERNFPFPTHYLGKLNDEISLALTFGAVDVFLAPSVQDNLPNTIIESLACGTPCAAFEVGGIPDQIDHKKNGYLAQPLNNVDFAHGIDWIIKDRGRWQELSSKARIKAEQAFDINTQVQLYMSLYKEIISR